MIVGICLNPCLDRTVEIPSLIVGGMNRIQNARMDYSGKGINVAIGVQRLGDIGHVLGFMFHQNQAEMELFLQREQVGYDWVSRPGSVRTNLKILDRSTQTITEVNDSGVQTLPDMLDELRAQVRRMAPASAAMAFTGSLPPGCPTGFYAQLIDIVRSASPRCLCLLDAEGDKLTQGLRATPDIIKPNDYELSLAVGRTLSTTSEVAQAAQELIGQARVVIVSMAQKGALATDGTHVYYAPPIQVDVQSTVGAGDCMVAGLLHGMQAGWPLRESFAYSVATATASVMTQGTALFQKAQVESILPRVRIETLED